jgi:hypothetical protein
VIGGVGGKSQAENYGRRWHLEIRMLTALRADPFTTPCDRSYLSLLTNHFSLLTALASDSLLQPRLLEALFHITGLKSGLHLIEISTHEQVEIEQS